MDDVFQRRKVTGVLLELAAEPENSLARFQARGALEEDRLIGIAGWALSM